MKLLSVFALLLAGLVAVHATRHIVKEQISAVPSGWSKLGRAIPNHNLDVTILVKQQNLEKLEEIFHLVSNPQHVHHYGKHLSHDEVNALVAPKPQHIAHVMQWLSSHGINTDSSNVVASPNKDMIQVTMTVAQAEALLKTEYFEFSHPLHKGKLIRALEYKLPEDLDEAIDLIGPVTRFPSEYALRRTRPSNSPAVKKVLNKKVKKASPNDCSLGVTPTCLRSLYNVNDYKANSTTSMVCTGYLEQYIAPSDLSTFFSTYDPSNARPATIIGPNDATNPGIEASLDIQYTMALAPGVEGQFWYTAGRQPNNTQNEPFLVFMQALASTPNPPLVISTSYGDDENTVDFNYAVRVNTEFQKAGVRGISVLFSSGDGGVSGGQAQQCTTFIPTYPAGSPYITAVGGTTGQSPEVAVSFSSGGFANYWPVADYQQSAVQTYLQTMASTLPPQNLWNQTGRGFPDVSAQASGFWVVQGGFPQPVDGTSCSTPTFAGIVALLNDIRLKAGKSPLGFLNYLLYQNPGMLTDVLSGSNPGCGTNGFSAGKGWDPVTGLGTPNFTAMSAVVQKLP